MMCRPMVRAIVVACAAIPAAAHAQTVFPEVEPNDTKAAAQPVGPMTAGDRITGVTTGTSLTVPGDASADYFLITVAPAPLGIYRHRLVITASPSGHIGNLRGSPQVPADPGPWPGPVGEVGTGDALLQATSLVTDPPRYLQWYGFGKGERIIFRITGTSVTTAPYEATLQTQPVEPAQIGPFAAGDIAFSTIGQGHDTNTDLWVFDADLNPIRGYGNDDESAHAGGSGATSQSLLVRRFPPGTYYLAVSGTNLATSRTSPCDDDFRAGPVHDFPGVVTTSAATPAADCSLAVTDAAGVHQVSAVRDSAYDVLWFRFEVVGEGASDCNANGIDDFLEVVNNPALDCWTAGIPAGTTGGPDGVLDMCQCTGNFSRDNAVNSADISAYLTAWLAAVTNSTADADMNCDGATNSTDISTMLTTWLSHVEALIPYTGCP
jgi:hypothetical protein